MHPTKIVCFVALALGAGGCVSEGTYKKAVAETHTTQAKLDRTNQSLAQSQRQVGTQRAEIERLEKLTAEAAETARAATYKELSLRLKKQIDDGDLSLVVRDGRMVLQLPNDVLFDTGRTELKPAGKNALEAVAEVMKTMPHRHFQVAGHTDNVPIHNATFASNWELSSGRALRVVHFLTEKGVDPSMLSAAGYGEIDPVAPNVSSDGRRMNRRTEITLQPDISEIVKVPE
jgi:chemotaxis protein MotB